MGFRQPTTRHRHQDPGRQRRARHRKRNAQVLATPLPDFFPCPRMSSVTPTFSIVIVSEDWFARSLLKGAAEEAETFGRIILADDGYTALAETWQAVEDGCVPEIFLIDQSAADASADRLVAELRADDITRRAYIAVLAPGDAPAKRGIDLAILGDARHPRLTQMMKLVAARAASRYEQSEPPEAKYRSRLVIRQRTRGK
jgi:hypothetical protein